MVAGLVLTILAQRISGTSTSCRKTYRTQLEPEPEDIPELMTLDAAESPKSPSTINEISNSVGEEGDDDES